MIKYVRLAKSFYRFHCPVNNMTLSKERTRFLSINSRESGFSRIIVRDEIAISRDIDNGIGHFSPGRRNKSWNYRLSMKRRVSMDSRVFILRYPSMPHAKAQVFPPFSGIAINSSHFLQGDITLMSITVPRRVLSTKRSPSWRRMSNLAFHHYPLALQRRLAISSLFPYFFMLRIC